MAENGHEPFYLRLERDGRALDDRALPQAVTQVPWRGADGAFGWNQVPRLAWALRRVAAEVRPDVIHAGPVQNCAFLAALAGLHPLVTMSWGSDLLKDAYTSAMMRSATRFTLGRSDALVGDCRAVQQAAAGFGFPAQRVTLFPWGVDLQRFAPAAGASEVRERLGWQDQFVVLSLRSWEPVYGVDVAVRGFAEAYAANPRLRMILLGAGSLAGQIQNLLYERNLHTVVHLGGQVSQNDLPRYYHAADAYLSASHSDGSSVSLMEALASGLPALVSDIPGNREWLEDGRAGRLFPDGDARALAAGLLALADDAPGLADMRAAARALAEERADWPKNAAKLNAAYRAAQNRFLKRGLE